MAVDDETRGTRAAAGDATADGGEGAYDSTAPGSQALTGDALTIVPTWGASAFASLPASSRRGATGNILPREIVKSAKTAAFTDTNTGSITNTGARTCTRHGIDHGFDHE